MSLGAADFARLRVVKQKQNLVIVLQLDFSWFKFSQEVVASKLV